MAEADEKAKLRDQLRQLRPQRFTKDPFLHLLSIPQIREAKVITSYISYGLEPSTSSLNAELLENNKVVLLPRISHNSLDWVRWSGDFEDLQQRGNLLEPIGESEKDLSIIDVVILPALYIDKDGFRLGKGGGYYDKSLPLFNAWKIALVHEGEVGDDQLPVEPHDVSVDAVATPNNVRVF